MRNFKHALIILFILVSACSSGAAVNFPNREDGVHVIKNNGGGKLTEFIGDYRRLEAWGGPVELRGLIASSAVIFTKLPNACLGAGARVGFHAISGIPVLTTGTAGPLYVSFLRNGIREQFLKDWGRKSEKTIITAREFARLDPEMKICGE